MFNFNNIFRIAAAATASVALLVSCAGLEQDQNDAVGYLAAPALDVDLTVDDLLLTKALDFDVEEPALSDVHFIVKDKNGTVRYDEDGLWSEPIVLPVGDYSIEASYGANGFGAPYFKGSSSGSVAQLAQETPELTLELSNSLVRVTVDPSLEGHFIPGSEVSFNDGAHVAGYGEWTYVPSGSDLALTLAGTSATGIPTDFIHNLPAPSAKVAYDVVCGKSETNWPSISWTSTPLADGAFEDGLYFKAAVPSNMSDANAAAMKYQIKGGDYADWTEVDASDVHGYKYISGLENGKTYYLRACVGNIMSPELDFSPVSFESCLAADASAVHNNAGNPAVLLSGTTVSASVNVNLPSIVKGFSNVTASVKFVNSDGEDRAEPASVGVNTAKSALNNIDGWPYIPQGKYTLRTDAVCSLDGNNITARISTTVTVPEPEFSLALSSYTSYDKYAASNNITKNINEANSCVAETLYKAGGQWGISVDLMKNPNYAKTLVIDIDGNDDRTYNLTSFDYNYYYEDIGTLSWGSHDLSVSFMFDGKEVSKNQTHQITGLPYDVDFTQTADEWTLSNTCTRKSDGLHFDPIATPYANKSFSLLSENVNVSLYLYSGVQLNATSAISVAHLDVQIGSNNNDKVLTAPTKFAGGKTTTTTETSVTGTLNGSSNTIKLETNALVSGMWVIVPGVRVVYR